MGKAVIGIDLGTLNSCAAAVQEGRATVLAADQNTTIPSCVAFQGDRELVGMAAKRHAVTHPRDTIIAVKRIIGHPFASPEVEAARAVVPYPIEASPKGSVVLKVAGRELTPVQVSARILQRVRAVAEKALGQEVTRAVISVPAHFNDVQRKATKLAAEYAGLEVLRLINEPTAAAFAYGYKKGSDFTLAVYDLGGGTFDVTVMRARGDTFEVLATDGDSYLGGEDFDRAIAAWLEQEFERQHGCGLGEDEPARLRLVEAAEKAKVELSQVETAQVELPFFTQLAGGERVDFRAQLTRAQADELVAPLVQKTIDLCTRCLDMASVATVEIDDVLLVGGQSRMASVHTAVAEKFGREPRRDINPDEVVAMGAALYAYSLCADELRDEAQNEAGEALAVALKSTDVARKLIDGVDELREKPGPDESLRALLDDLLKATQAGDDTPIPKPKPRAAPRPAAEPPPAAAKPAAPVVEEADPSRGGPASEFLDPGAFDFVEEDPTDRSEAAAPPSPPPAAPQAPKPSGDADLPAAVEGLQDELYALDRKVAELTQKASGEDDCPEWVDSAVERIQERLEVARAAQLQASERLEVAERHASARRVKLHDVTSLPLGIAAAGDVFTLLIDQNTRVPAQHQRVFTTNQDGQSEVEIRVFQGRGKRSADNQLLGSFILEGIAPAPRMRPKIAVFFRIDENGILAVKARDKASGAEQGIRVEDPLGLQGVEAEPEQDASEGAEPDETFTETDTGTDTGSGAFGSGADDKLVQELADDLASELAAQLGKDE